MIDLFYDKLEILLERFERLLESAIGPVIGAFKFTGEAVDFGDPSFNKESKHITYEKHLAHSVDSFLDLA